MPNHNKTVKKVKREERRAQVAELYLTGNYTQTQIADTLGVTQGVISGDLKHCRNIYNERNAQSTKEQQAQSGDRIRQQLNRAYTNYKDTKDNGLKHKWWQAMMKCEEEFRKLYGLDKVGPSINFNLSTDDLANLTDDELNALIGRVDSAAS